MPRGIRIAWESSRYVYGKHDGVRLRIASYDACDMEGAIFAYRMLPTNPATGEQAAFFSHICSPVDIDEYPETEPLPSHRPEWLRLSYVDVHVRSPTEAQNLVDAVLEDVQRLVTTLNTMDTLIPGDTNVVGTLCPDDEEEPTSSESEVPSESSAESLGSLLTITATGTNDRNVGDLGIAWSQQLTGAGSPLDSVNYHAVGLTPGASSKLLLIQGFDFSELPDDAVIAGITVRLVSRWVEDDGGFTYSPQVTFLALAHPEVGNSDNYGEGQFITGPSYNDLIAGGESDTWGVTWPAKKVKRGEFSVLLLVALPAEANDEMSIATVQVDGAEVTLSYR